MLAKAGLLHSTSAFILCKSAKTVNVNKFLSPKNCVIMNFKVVLKD